MAEEDSQTEPVGPTRQCPFCDGKCKLLGVRGDRMRWWCEDCRTAFTAR